MSKDGYFSFFAFAIEVYRHDPYLFHICMESATRQLRAAHKVCSKHDLAAQEKCIREIYKTAGLMKFLNEDDPAKLPEFDTSLLPRLM